MSKIYTCNLEVRGYELDSFGHVNHAVYVSYLEHARWKMLEQEGITLAKLDEWKRWPVIAQLEINYLKPTYLGQTLEVRTHVLEHGKTNFLIEQTIFFEKTPVLRGKVRVVTVDERGRPASLPEQVAELWRTN